MSGSREASRDAQGSRFYREYEYTYAINAKQNHKSGFLRWRLALQVSSKQE